MSEVNALAGKSLDELLQEQKAIDDIAELAKHSAAALQAELDRRFGDHQKVALIALGKTSGTNTTVQPGGLRLKAETRAKVKWDQSKLWALAADLSREDLEHYCKIELTPKEAVYKALLPTSNIRGALADARTDEPGTTKYRLLAEGEK